MPMRRPAVPPLLLCLVLTACTGGFSSADPGDPAEAPPAQARVNAPADPTTVLTEREPVALALATTRALWAAAPVVVVAPADDPEAQVRAAGAAETAGAPMLLEGGRPAEITTELERLGTETVLSFGGAGRSLAAGDVDAAVQVVPGPGEAPATPGAEASPAAARLEPIPTVEVTGTVDGLVVLAPPGPDAAAATATARAAGARVVVSEVDPRADAETVRALADEPFQSLLALGPGFGNPETARWRAEVAATGTELPGGGQLVFPGRRLVALYGHPGTSALGVLGEQDADASVERARQLVADYQPYSDEPVMPAFEIIATVASEFAGPDGNYSTEADPETLRPYVDAAAEQGVYVVLDLQPGRTDFLTQAKLYEELLREPHVGLALDPEWRLEPNQVHLRQIGTVTAAEIEEVADWLAGLVREQRLPQKLLLLHQFQTRMISERETLDADRDELAVLVQMDGNGPPASKFATWERLLENPPGGLRFGWKNFYDEDSPTFTPEQTMAVEPTPWWVSYQ